MSHNSHASYRHFNRNETKPSHRLSVHGKGKMFFVMNDLGGCVGYKLLPLAPNSSFWSSL